MASLARCGCRQAARSSGCSSSPGHRSNPHCGAKPRKIRRSGHARCVVTTAWLRGVLLPLCLRTKCTCSGELCWHLIVKVYGNIFSSRTLRAEVRTTKETNNCNCRDVELFAAVESIQIFTRLCIIFTVVV